MQKLIGFDSVTGNEGEIQAFIAATLKEQRIKVDRFEPDPNELRDYSSYLERERSFEGRPNVVGTWRGSGGDRSLLLNGHVDTGPIEPMEKWQEHPLSGSPDQRECSWPRFLRYEGRSRRNDDGGAHPPRARVATEKRRGPRVNEG